LESTAIYMSKKKLPFLSQKHGRKKGGQTITLFVFLVYEMRIIL